MRKIGSMSQSKTKTSQITRVETSEPKLFHVVFHNDDVTTMDFVVFVIMSVFKRSRPEAQRLMMKVHTEGTAVVGTYSYDIAMSKRDRTLRLAHVNHFPLRVSVEQA